MVLKNGPLRIGIGGPVRAGKTILTAALAKILQPKPLSVSSPMTSTRKKDADTLMRMKSYPKIA